ncbi:cupredoxin domain-containing protein [Nitrosopumilus sp.]|uniref:cupredoxin domain-containing protein n=1 Tax=Nitrosopumilus sp. TaxID=2024843 RepID=UPI003D11EC7B
MMILEKAPRTFSRKVIIGMFALVMFFTIEQSHAEEYTISIPFGAFNPELNTPAEVWYDPPELTIQVGDTVTWTNDDREGHTVTSGDGAGRFDWMGSKNLGEADGIFDSERFMPEESWSYTFEKEGPFNYFCIIHPWMEGIVFVKPFIPDYPHDGTGKKHEQFPMYQITPDQSIEINFSWEPQIIKTHEKVNFIYRFYDAVYDLPLRKMQYDISIIHNGNLVFEEKGAVSSAGGDYRQWIYEEPGTTIVKIKNIKPFGTVAETQIQFGEDASARLADFSAIVYENTEKTFTSDEIVQPRQTVQFYYEIAVAIIVVPGVMLLVAVLYMKNKGSDISTNQKERKATPV